ncbi:unnamed protein product [Effrenium voratum]|nr:unnamed protein product [Effrenium voratum]
MGDGLEPKLPCRYLAKMLGAGEEPPPRVSAFYMLCSFLGAFSGISVLASLHSRLMKPEANLVLLIGAFGAMSVLLFSACKAYVAQPLNVILGNTLGGLVGVTVFELMAFANVDLLWLTAALAVSLTILAQELTRSVHPPGAATALIYVITPSVQHLGMTYVFCPAFLGAVILVAVACVTNNLSPDRTYPQYWWPWKSIRLESDSQEEASIESKTPRFGRLHSFLAKFRGDAEVPVDAFPLLQQSWCSFLGSFLGIAVLALIHERLFPDAVLLIGSCGAVAGIVFSSWRSPLGQPKNVILGNTLGGLAGFLVQRLLSLASENGTWLTAPLALALTITLQELGNAVHPPGGATALLFAMDPSLQRMGYMYVLSPSFLGAVILVSLGCLTNNLAQRQYPQYWFPPLSVNYFARKAETLECQC